MSKPKEVELICSWLRNRDHNPFYGPHDQNDVADFIEQQYLPPEPASNEEIERRILAESLKRSDGEWTDEQFYLWDEAVKFGLFLSSELKAHKLLTQTWRRDEKSGVRIEGEWEPLKQKPVDEGLEEAEKYRFTTAINNLGKDITQEHITDAFKAGHSRGEAIGEAKGWRDAIEYIRKTDDWESENYKTLEDEAKRRGIKL